MITTTPTEFASEASIWTVSLLQTTSTLKYTLCGSTYLLGGYNVLGTVANSYPGGYFGSSGQYGQYFSRLYSALPTHSWVYFTMTFWTIDYWKGPSSCSGSPTCQDHWDITVGGTTFSGWVLDQSYYNSLSSSCGNSASDLPNIRLFGRVAHTATSLTFTITSRLAQASSIESWGVRDVNFLFVTSPSAQGSSQDICAFAPVTLPTSPISTCPCYSEGNYKQGNGVGVGACKTCDPACSSCFDNGPTNCFQCASGYYWDGTQCAPPPICSTLCATCTGTASNQCITCVPGAFLYNGNSCIPTCDPPLVQGLALGITTCSLPCGPDLFLDWLGNCIPFCDFPLNATGTNTVIGYVFTCVYPCATTEYLYWDGSCQTSCDSSLYLPNVISLRNFCNWTCTVSPNIILYWDGTCGSSCAFPLDIRFEYNRTYCYYPCATGQYLYNNGSCLSYCQTYFISSTAHGELFCDFPCSSTQYLLDTGSCISTCNSYYTNLTMVGDKYCYYPCLPNQYFYTNGSCLSTCDWRFNYVVTNGQNFCNFPCGSQYLYLNGSCAAYCTPYYTSWFDNRRYCDNPCNNTYMYGNGTCSSTCDTAGYFLVVPQGSDLTCIFPCRPSEYLYSNGSCLLSCRPFFVPLLYGTDHFCNYPCNNTASEYLYYNGSCLSTCSSPYISSAIGSDHFCDLPCRSNEYYYLNGSCIPWCPSTFIEHSLGIEMYCDYPCASLEYLYANGSCLSSCRSDYTVKTYGTDLFCEFPCGTDDYLYDNGTCLSSCSSSLWTFTQENDNFYCQFPCSDPTTYSYADGTCSSSCSFPFVASSDGAYKFCVSPCNSTEYLFIDDTCITDCSSPFVVVSSGDVNLCTSSCSSPGYYLLTSNGSCLASCPSPFKSYTSPLNILLCSLPCNDPLYYYYPDSKSCSSVCTQQPNTNSEGYLECLPSSDTTFLDTISSPPESPDTISIIVLAKIVQHIRYIDIKLPPRLENLRYGHGRYPLSLQYGLPMPSTLEAKFINYPLPTIFSAFHSSFLVNFWQSLTLISLCILAGLILFFLEISFKYLKIDYWRIIFERLGVLFRWNIVIILIAFNADLISLYSSFEFRTFTSFESLPNAFSFFICSIICLVSLMIPIASYFLSCSISQYKSQALNSKSFKSYRTFLGKYQSLQVLFRGFNTNSSWTTVFYCIYFCRIFSPMAIAGYLYFTPLTQAIMHSVISILIVLYLIILRPMNRMINNIQLISIETSVLVINICMLIFAIYDTFEIESPENLIAVGNIVIISNFCLNVLLLFFLAFKILFIVRAAWVLRKKDGLDTISVLLQVISLPFQQSCYGFEQLQFVRFDDTYYDLDEDYYTQKKFDHEIEIEEAEKEQEKQSEANTNITPPLIISATELPNESLDMLNQSSSYSSRRPMVSRKPQMRPNFSPEKKDPEIFIPLPDEKILEDPKITRDFSWISEANNEGEIIMLDKQVDEPIWEEEMNQQVMVDPGEMSNEEEDVGDGEREYQVKEGEDGRMEVDIGEREVYPKMSRVPTEIMREFGENNQMIGETTYMPVTREIIGPFSPIEYEDNGVFGGERMIYKKV